MKGNQESMLYTTNATVAALNHVSGFDPLKFLRRTTSRKTGEDVMRLDLRYKKLWFRLACPTGRLKLNALRITEKMAIFEAKVYRDREDAEPLSSYVANCTLDTTPGGLYVEAAQEEALDTALSNAGFGIQFADVGSESEEYGSEVPVGAKPEISKLVQTKAEVAEPVQKQPEPVKATPQESANGFSDALDETQTKTHRILRVQKEDVSFLREKNADMAMLKKYQSYVAINLRGRKELFQWKIDNKVAEISTDVFRYMTAEKFMHYMEAQLPIYCDTRPANRYREPTMKTLVTMYVDYLHMCRRQAYDMKDKSVLFPKNCAAAHDREAERIQKINDAQKKKAFCMAYAGFARKAALSNKELQIVCPKQANDLVDEGKALHHCVGGYIDSVAEGRSLIVFVRRVEEPKKPYVTVEVRDGKIAQIHGDHNSAPTEEVQKFVDLWSRKVLPIALQVA